MDVGDVVTINPGTRHEFMTEVGAVVEEISSTHYRADSYYSDPVIEQNANRKSIVKVNQERLREDTRFNCRKRDSPRLSGSRRRGYAS